MSLQDVSDKVGTRAPGSDRAGRRRGWLRYAPIVVIALGAAAALIFGRDYLSWETLAANREALAAWRAENVVWAGRVYLLGYALVVAFSVPGAAWMTIAGGFIFGTVAATLMTTVAATVGATAIFLAARTSLRDVLRAKAGAWLGRLDREFEEGEISFLLIIRLVPVVPFFIANLAPAFLNVRLVNFVWTTFVGIIPGTVVYAAIGSGLGDVLDRGERPDPGVILEPHILLPLLGLAALAALPVVVRKWRRRRG